MCLSIGVSSRICLLGLQGFVGLDRRWGGDCRVSAVPHWGLPLILSFSLFITARRLLMLVPGVCTYGAISHATYCTWINLLTSPMSVIDIIQWVLYLIIIPQTLAKLDLSDTSRITEVHTGWWMCTAQEWKKSLFNFSVDCVCCRMLRGTVWKAYITRYNTEVCEGWSLEVCFIFTLSYNSAFPLGNE